MASLAKLVTSPSSALRRGTRNAPSTTPSPKASLAPTTTTLPRTPSRTPARSHCTRSSTTSTQHPSISRTRILPPSTATKILSSPSSASLPTRPRQALPSPPSSRSPSPRSHLPPSTWRNLPVQHSLSATSLAPQLLRRTFHSSRHSARRGANSGARASLLAGAPMTLLVGAAAVTGALALFTRFHGRWYERRCQVVSGDGPIVRAIEEALEPWLGEPYRPGLPIPDRHVETIFAAFTRSRPDVVFKRECLPRPDGGVVALDWPLHTHELAEVPPAAPGAPVLIMLPGLTGGSEDTYVRHLLVRARKAGLGAVVFNSRGCAHSPVTTPQFYSASFTEDLRGVVEHVKGKFPQSRLYAAGWSLGANILVRYLGQEGDRTPLAGAVSLCNPFDLVLSDLNWRKGFNRLYDNRLAQSLNAIFSRHQPLFEGLEGEYDIELVKRAKTVREFDMGLTRVSFGYPSVDAYYADSSSSRSIKDVGIPLLCIQAKDDPIAPEAGIPYAAIKENKNCLLVVTPYGGHLGWIAGNDSPLGAPWTDPPAMRFLEELEGIQVREAWSPGKDSEAYDDFEVQASAALAGNGSVVSSTNN